MKFGLVPELVGRLPVITTLDDLDEEALIRILTEPKNALVKQYQKLFDFDDIELELTDDALNAIAAEGTAKPRFYDASGKEITNVPQGI